MQFLRANLTLFEKFLLQHFCEQKEKKKERDQMMMFSSYAPKELRVNIPLTNLAEFAEAFHCSPGSPMNSAISRQRIFI
ncbi:unnamed protein product [Cylicocyclus nassatus]|uniref:Peptidase M13 C-terminal domain-containing protein n=1 Tax=Cylicocyclus nassatus TaxID=53992 RepID=A0AA36MDL6_CYLNA|nr:unnamed protein product [Cylicocyclus nassatus]